MYKLNQSGSIQRLADNASIPPVKGNRDFDDYEKWLAAGNVPTPADVPKFADLSKSYLDEVRETRERILNRLAGIAAAALAAGDAATSAAFLTCRQQLLDITKAPAVLAATTLPELRAAVTVTYKNIAAAAPANVRAAFNNVDA